MVNLCIFVKVIGGLQKDESDKDNLYETFIQ